MLTVTLIFRPRTTTTKRTETGRRKELKAKDRCQHQYLDKVTHRLRTTKTTTEISMGTLKGHTKTKELDGEIITTTNSTCPKQRQDT